MAERRKVRSGTSGRTSTRSREPTDQDEQEMLESEPMDPESDEFLDADEPEETDDEFLDADEPEEVDEPEVADEEESRGNGRRRPARRQADRRQADRRQADRRSASAMTAGEAAKAALRQIAELTAKQPESITQVARTEDGWAIGIEVVEDQRIPSSSDILAIYETTIDADGELVSYRRVKRYARGRGDSEEL